MILLVAGTIGFESPRIRPEGGVWLPFDDKGTEKLLFLCFIYSWS